MWQSFLESTAQQDSDPDDWFISYNKTVKSMERAIHFGDLWNKEGMGVAQGEFKWNV